MREFEVRKFELPCYDGRKSFYGKAMVEELRGGSVNTATLYSYDTEVAKIIRNEHGYNFIRCWDGYSATTMRHVNSFLKYYGQDEAGKAFWDKCPIWVPVELTTA